MPTIDQATKSLRWDTAPPRPARPMHIAFQSLEDDPPSGVALRAAIGTSVPSAWIGPETVEIALGYFPLLRRDPLYVDPDLVVLHEKDEQFTFEVRLRWDPESPAPEPLALQPSPWGMPTSAPVHSVPAIAQIASEVKDIADLSDASLGAIFPVTREHFCRWRTGAEEAPTEANLRQLLALHRLLRALSRRVASPKDWLLAPLEDADGGVSPYELLRNARFEAVWHLVEALPASSDEARYLLDETGDWTSIPATPIPYDHDPDDSPPIPLDWDGED